MRRVKIASALLAAILLVSLAGCLSVDRITARMSGYLDIENLTIIMPPGNGCWPCFCAGITPPAPCWDFPP